MLLGIGSNVFGQFNIIYASSIQPKANRFNAIYWGQSAIGMKESILDGANFLDALRIHPHSDQGTVQEILKAPIIIEDNKLNIFKNFVCFLFAIPFVQHPK